MSATKLEHLQGLQTRTQALMVGGRSKDGGDCKWLSISNLIKYDKVVVMYKKMNYFCPGNVRGIFLTRPLISSYSTRNQLDIDIPRQNLEFSNRSFFYSDAKTWISGSHQIESHNQSDQKELKGIP